MERVVDAAEAKCGPVPFRKQMWELLHDAEPTEYQRLVAALPISNFIDLTLDRGLAKALRAIGKQPVEHGPLSGRMGSWKLTEPARPHVFYALARPPVGGEGFGGVRSTIADDGIVRANVDEMLHGKDLLLAGLTPHEAEFILHLHLFVTSAEKIVNCAPAHTDPDYWTMRGVYLAGIEPAAFLSALLPADGNSFGFLDAIIPSRMMVDIFRRQNQVFISHAHRDGAFVD